jgi:predicted GNAT family acetyltransferase
MTSLIRTDSDNKDFIQLVKALDADLAHRDGNEHSFYDQFNKIDTIRHVVVAYENDKPVSCGAMKEVNPATMEIKRMYTIPESRGKGLATKVLTQLEHGHRIIV